MSDIIPGCRERTSFILISACGLVRVTRSSKRRSLLYRLDSDRLVLLFLNLSRHVRNQRHFLFSKSSESYSGREDINLSLGISARNPGRSRMRINRSLDRQGEGRI